MSVFQPDLYLHGQEYEWATDTGMPGLSLMLWYTSHGRSLMWGMSEGNLSVNCHLNSLSSFRRSACMARCLTHNLIDVIMLGGPVMYSSKSKCAGFSSKTAIISLCMRIQVFFAFFWPSLIEQASCFCLWNGEDCTLLWRSFGSGG